ncbi:ssra-binding protein [Mycoplasmopsis californica HAZ160_1]|uniref:SsrA-binding protein n=2 Tax=Mycoplasmopsis californica TaxID=2113 RepID=A0A059XX57_9BACT|nr:SsrA-binding protein [Mycoplasmopsis californica]AIA29782.1 ssrA-binding protein [Mycoplasmopsis californica]BAP00790.1 ssra-binding protein [Mycoplasmopsis californica HAZ160_1]BBG40643.1 ssra-binding protein [Mycoplasmopsis californica]BBG41238.1 ssra-binding protein [Mycoplasmopsis californica]BBG41831.1 ssra-binding protein [Mycoplasmopsis californica]
MKIISDNRKGLHGHSILEKHEAGIVLEGWEVKSARAKTVQLTSSYCFFRAKELFLCNATFKEYMLIKSNPTQDRKLLLHRNELLRLQTKKEHLGNATILPTKIYFNDKGKIKVEIALVTSMNKADKREQIKKRDNERYLKKVLKNYS